MDRADQVLDVHEGAGDQPTGLPRGVQLGGKVRWQEDWFFVGAYGKVAFGATQQSVLINGSTTVHSATLGDQTATGGILALPSNIGDYRRTIFGIVPEAGINFGVEFTY